MQVREIEPFRVAINRKATGKIPPDDPLWGTFNDSFANQTLDVMTFANEIYTGHAYTNWHTGRRSLANFQCGQYLALDCDSGDKQSSIDYLLDDQFISTYGTIIHSTPSSTPQRPRSRVIFVLDRIITDAGAYQQAAKFLVALYPWSDPACTDASRFFFGCKDCQIELPYRQLPLSHLRAYHRRFRHILDRSAATPQEAPPPPPSPAQQASSAGSVPTGRDLQTVLLDRAIRQAPAEGRNLTGLWLACQLRDNGFSREQGREVMQLYQMSVQGAGSHPYTVAEAWRNLNNAFTRPPRDAWPESGSTIH